MFRSHSNVEVVEYKKLNLPVIIDILIISNTNLVKEVFMMSLWINL